MEGKTEPEESKGWPIGRPYIKEMKGVNKMATKWNVKKPRKSNKGINKIIKNSVYELRAAQVHRYQERARKEISRLESEGWTLSPKLREKAFAEYFKKYTEKQAEAMKSLLQISTIRNRAYRDIKFIVQVADVQFDKEAPGQLDLDLGEITNYRTQEKMVRMSYKNPGQALRKAMRDTLKYGKAKEEAANFIGAMLQSFETDSGRELLGDKIFREDFTKNLSKYIPSAKKLTEALKYISEDELNPVDIYSRATQMIQAMSQKWGSSLSEAAAKWEEHREAVDQNFLNNPKHAKYDREDLRRFKRLWYYLPSKAWTHYRRLYDSNDVIEYFDEMVQYDEDYDFDDLLNNFKTGVVREDTPEEIRDRTLNNIESSKVFRQN